MSKQKSKIIQLNGETNHSTYTYCFLITEKNRIVEIFSESDEDNQDKYLFRDLSYLTSLGKTFYEVARDFDIIEHIDIQNYFLPVDFLELTPEIRENLTFENAFEFFDSKSKPSVNEVYYQPEMNEDNNYLEGELSSFEVYSSFEICKSDFPDEKIIVYSNNDIENRIYVDMD